MPDQALEKRIHVVESTDWKDAVISLLEPSSPYRPWRHGDEDAHDGEAVAMILNTEPRSVLTILGRVGPHADLMRITTDMGHWGANLLNLATFAVMVGGFGHRGDPRSDWLLHGEAAEHLEHGLEERRYSFDQIGRLGHTSMAAAYVLLHSKGRCDGCDEQIDLRGSQARDRVHVRTVDYDTWPYGRSADEQNQDWPAALCDECHQGMRKGGFRTFLDFRFSKHPQCPTCGEYRTGSTCYGMPVTQDFSPWEVVEGCVVHDAQWRCLACRHAW